MIESKKMKNSYGTDVEPYFFLQPTVSPNGKFVCFFYTTDENFSKRVRINCVVYQILPGSKSGMKRSQTKQLKAIGGDASPDSKKKAGKIIDVQRI